MIPHWADFSLFLYNSLSFSAVFSLLFATHRDGLPFSNTLCGLWHKQDFSPKLFFDKIHFILAFHNKQIKYILPHSEIKYILLIPKYFPLCKEPTIYLVRIFLGLPSLSFCVVPAVPSGSLPKYLDPLQRNSSEYSKSPF